MRLVSTRLPRVTRECGRESGTEETDGTGENKDDAPQLSEPVEGHVQERWVVEPVEDDIEERQVVEPVEDVEDDIQERQGVDQAKERVEKRCRRSPSELRAITLQDELA